MEGPADVSGDDPQDLSPDFPADMPEDPVQETLPPGRCFIDGTEYLDGQENPGNDCQACRSGESVDAWSLKPDMASCASGVCCTGLCRAGGNCCQGADCAGLCTGTAAGCPGLPDQASCGVQSGCTWTSFSGSCGGTSICENITVVLLDDCSYCGCSGINCSGSDCICSGVPDPCSYTTEADCRKCACAWISTSGECSGTARACDALTTSSACASQSGCAWQPGTCTGFACR